jgi:hypothetical protein
MSKRGRLNRLRGGQDLPRAKKIWKFFLDRNGAKCENSNGGKPQKRKDLDQWQNTSF